MHVIRISFVTFRIEALAPNREDSFPVLMNMSRDVNYINSKSMFQKHDL